MNDGRNKIDNIIMTTLKKDNELGKHTVHLYLYIIQA